MALGTAETVVANMVLRQGTRVVVAGLAVGLVAAFGLTRVLDSLLYDVSATDLMTYVALASLLLSVALLTTYVPAPGGPARPPRRVASRVARHERFASVLGRVHE